MSELKKWRVTGPDGFERIFEERDEYWALRHAHIDVELSPVQLMRQAGYRAEPIEEPKMVTVRAEDVEAVVGARPASLTEITNSFDRLRAALESAK